MVITKMNSVFVKHGRWFFGGFTLIIIISFVWFFTPGLDGSIFFGNPNSPSAVVGKAFGEKVTRGELIASTGSMTLAMAASYNMPPNDSRIREMAWARAFDTYAALAAAKRLGVAVSNAEVADFIKAMPAFRNDKGAFDLKRFEDYKLKALAPSGYTAVDLDNAVRDLLTVMKVERLAASEVIVTPDEVKEYQLATSERLDVRVLRFNSKDFEAAVPVTEDALKAFYAANNQFFILPPKFQAETVRFNYANFDKAAAALVTDAMVKDYYGKNQAEFKKGDAVSPLAEVAGKIKKSLCEAASKSLAMTDARKFRDDLYEATSELNDGAACIAAFRRLAKERGIEVYETGWFDSVAENIKNVGKEPAFIETVSVCTERRPIAKATPGVKAAFVSVMTGKKDAAVGEYNEVKPKVEERYRQLKAISLSREKAADAALKISEAKNPPAAADSFAIGKIKFEKIPSFSQTEPATCADAAEVMELAFSVQPGKLSKTKETSAGALLVFVDKRTPATAAELEKGREQAERIYKQRKQMALVDSFNNWIKANSESYIAREDSSK